MPRTGSNNTRKTAPAGRGGAKKTARAAPAAQDSARTPRRREIAAAVCFILSIFTFIGFWGADGVFIGLFSGLAKGLFGGGMFALAPALLLCAVILTFHRGRPVRFRVTCTLLLSLMTGALVHLFGCKLEYEISFAMLGKLWKDGRSLEAGGAVSGSLSLIFSWLFSKAGAAVVFICVTLFLLLAALNKTIAGFVDAWKRREKRAYVPEPEPAQEPDANVAAARYRPPVLSKRKKAIDIPLDGEPGGAAAASPGDQQSPGDYQSPYAPSPPAGGVPPAGNAPPWQPDQQEQHGSHRRHQRERGDQLFKTTPRVKTPDQLVAEYATGQTPGSDAAAGGDEAGAGYGATPSIDGRDGRGETADSGNHAAEYGIQLDIPFMDRRPGEGDGRGYEPPRPLTPAGIDVPMDYEGAAPGSDGQDGSLYEGQGSPMTDPDAERAAAGTLRGADGGGAGDGGADDGEAADYAGTQALYGTQTPDATQAPDGTQAPGIQAPGAHSAGAEQNASTQTAPRNSAQRGGRAKPEEPPQPSYIFPPLDLLSSGKPSKRADGSDEIRINTHRLEAAFRSFGVNVTVSNATRGPAVTRYEAELEPGVKLNKLTSLADDIALSLGKAGVRIAAMPNMISTVGVEVPNTDISTVYLRDIIESREFTAAKSKLTFAIGMDISGEAVVGSISKMPHMLVAGTTGSGKSVCLNSVILSMLYKATPDDVRFIMIDPKMVEFKVYNDIPHLLVPVVTDVKKAAGALQWAVVEMMKRYKLFSETNAREIEGYNQIAAQDEERETLPQIIVVIDELADLMMMAAKEVEDSIVRVAQMGRAAGVHLIIATQSPRADVITGLMKANIPSRIAFKVSSALESRIILDAGGNADKLVGNGDMLYAPVGTSKPMRLQGTLVSDAERESVIDYIKRSGESQYSEEVMEEIEKAAVEKAGGDKADAESGSEEPGGSEYDELLPQAVNVIFETNQASVSMLQRRLKLGYSRAARIVDQMEQLGVVGPYEGSKPRALLVTREQWRQMQYVNGIAPVDTPFPDDE